MDAQRADPGPGRHGRALDPVAGARPRLFRINFQFFVHDLFDRSSARTVADAQIYWLVLGLFGMHEAARVEGPEITRVSDLISGVFRAYT